MAPSHKTHEAFKGTVERITGPRTVSSFKEKGVLSVQRNHSRWESGKRSKKKLLFPAEKQLLVSRNVPCLRRAASVKEEYEAAGGELLLDNGDDDGWLVTHGKSKETKVDEDENMPSMEALEISAKTKPYPNKLFLLWGRGGGRYS